MPVNTTITFECPEGYKLASDWNVTPKAEITCTANGTFSMPEKWEVCSSS